ncbi:hypothetical protein [Maridesulfovibrio sp.]|uniref:hypothetical protein n=1 Tax=Maridesulfovibrio sp. TaxID=2795000 RepID=UPI0039F032EF
MADYRSVLHLRCDHEYYEDRSGAVFTFHASIQTQELFKKYGCLIRNDDDGVQVLFDADNKYIDDFAQEKGSLLFWMNSEDPYASIYSKMELTQPELQCPEVPLAGEADKVFIAKRVEGPNLGSSKVCFYCSARAVGKRTKMVSLKSVSGNRGLIVVPDVRRGLEIRIIKPNTSVRITDSAGHEEVFLAGGADSEIIDVSGYSDGLVNMEADKCLRLAVKSTDRNHAFGVCSIPVSAIGGAVKQFRPVLFTASISARALRWRYVLHLRNISCAVGDLHVVSKANSFVRKKLDDKRVCFMTRRALPFRRGRTDRFSLIVKEQGIERVLIESLPIPDARNIVWNEDKSDLIAEYDMYL